MEDCRKHGWRLGHGARALFFAVILIIFAVAAKGSSGDYNEESVKGMIAMKMDVKSHGKFSASTNSMKVNDETIATDRTMSKYVANYFGPTSEPSVQLSSDFRGLCAIDAALKGALGYPCTDTSVGFCNGLWTGVACNAGVVNVLNLADRGLTGSIPTEIGLMTNLKELYLYYNSLTSTIPTEVGLLTVLEVLHLGGNSLHFSIPTEIGLLASLQQLFLYGNNLIGTIPTTIGLLKSLLLMGLDNNKLTGSIPTAIGLMQSLSILDLHGNKFIGTIPTQLGLLNSLHILHLGSTGLGGTIPTQLCGLPNLGDLYLDTNPGLSCYPTCLSKVQKQTFDSEQTVCTPPKTSKPTLKLSTTPSVKPATIQKTGSRRPHVRRYVSRSPSFGPHRKTKSYGDKKKPVQPNK